jgi:hypothetical protein
MSATQPLRRAPLPGIYLRATAPQEQVGHPEFKRLRSQEPKPLATPGASASLARALAYTPYSQIDLSSPALTHDAVSVTSQRSAQGLLPPSESVSPNHNKRSLALGASSVASRMSLMAASEALTHGFLTHSKHEQIMGWLLGAGAVGGLLAAAHQAQLDIAHTSKKYAVAHTVSTLLGAGCLVGGGYMRQWAALSPSVPHSFIAMGLIAAGGAEALATTGQAYIAGERVHGRTPMHAHSQASLLALDIGVVVTMTYGLATRLNNFSLTADYVVLGAAYTTAMLGAVWQYADAIWLKDHNVLTPDALRAQKTSHWPTVGVAFTLGVKIALLVGMKLLIDGTLLDEQWQVVGGAILTMVCTGTIVAPQLAYFHRDIAKQNPHRARQVTFGVIVGAMLLAAGAGIREWAAIQKNLPLARGSMALAGLGALSIVTCSSISLAASERVRGKSPIKHRAEFALALQVVGASLGLAYGLGIRLNKFNFIYDDVALCAGYIAMSLAGAVSYSESQSYLNPPSAEAIEMPHYFAR